MCHPYVFPCSAVAKMEPEEWKEWQNGSTGSTNSREIRPAFHFSLKSHWESGEISPTIVFRNSVFGAPHGHRVARKSQNVAVARCCVQLNNLSICAKSAHSIEESLQVVMEGKEQVRCIRERDWQIRWHKHSVGALCHAAVMGVSNVNHCAVRPLPKVTPPRKCAGNGYVSRDKIRTDDEKTPPEWEMQGRRCCEWPE